MAKLNLLAKLAAIANVKLEFSGVSVTKDREGNKVAILTLATPMEMVRGSQNIEIAGKQQPIIARDVEEIRVHQSVIDQFNDQFSFDTDTDSGSYEGEDLVLDVAKSTGQVFLVNKTFAAVGSDMRGQGRTNRTQSLIDRQAALRGIKTDAAAPRVQPV